MTYNDCIIENKLLKIKYYCIQCLYKTNSKQKYDKHLESIKHINNICNINYSCEVCNYNTNKKTNYDKHIETIKHKKIVDINNIESFLCRKCNKNFCSVNSLSRHNKKFHEQHNSNNIVIDKDIFINLISQNQDFKSLLIEQQQREQQEKHNREEKEHQEQKKREEREYQDKKDLKEIILELAKKNTNTICNNNITNNNKQFNLHFFLNEQCKNAINITDFIDSVEVELEDVEYVGINGYVNGITKIIMKHLEKLDIYNRPIHCTDLKREVIHIRDENKWNKESTKEKIKDCVEKIATKNCRKIALWQEVNKDSKILDSKCYNLWLDIIHESMNTGERGERNTEKVIKNIAKNVILEK